MGRETNKQRRERQAASAREKAAAARLEARRAEQRRRATVILSSVVVIAVVAAVIVWIGVTHKGSNNKAGDRAVASASVLKTLATIPAADFNTVGQGNAGLEAKAINDPPLTSGGKPEFLFVGAEFCPYCAAERWGIIAALDRFGSFQNLHEISSSSTDTDPNTPTFTFYKSSYTSKYLSFVPVENEDRSENQLVKMTSAQTKIFSKYTTGYPFMYFGGKYVQTSPSYDPGDLAGLTQQKVADQLSDTSSKVSKDILGTANTITAMVCKMTNNQPSSVCDTPMITNLQSQLGA